MRQITVDQSHQVLATLATNTDWSSIDFEGSNLQELVIRNPKEAGRQFTLFLKNGGRMPAGNPKVISIDRTKIFSPSEFIGAGWSIEEEDERSLALTEVDLTKVRLETMLKKNEGCVRGEEKFNRLKKAGYIRLDAGVFMSLWEKKVLIPEDWKGKAVFFDGTILRSPAGSRCVLCLFWADGEWGWDYYWLDDSWDTGGPSAVLSS